MVGLGVADDAAGLGDLLGDLILQILDAGERGFEAGIGCGLWRRALRGGLRWTTQGRWVQDLPPNFQWAGLGQASGEILLLAITGILALAFAWALANLRAGRALYATGSDKEAARLAGISPPRVICWVFVLTGLLTGLAAALNAIRFREVQSSAGVGLELKTIAAVVVGGAAITGGRGTLLGTLIGVLLLGFIGPALTYAGISAYWEKAIQGSIILAAVAADATRKARAGGSTR